MSVSSLRVIVALSLLLGACVPLPIPHENRLTPVYSGVVADVETDRPISGVTVEVEVAAWLAAHTGPRSATAETSQDGHYEAGVTERAAWFIVWIVPAEGLCGGRVRFTHPDYEPFSFETRRFGSAAFGGTCVGAHERRDVRLKKQRAEDSVQSP